MILIPVSYTHLDVYKRQVVIRVKENRHSSHRLKCKSRKTGASGTGFYMLQKIAKKDYAKSQKSAII